MWRAKVALSLKVIHPKRRFGMDEKKDESLFFDCVFNGSYPKSSPHALEKGFENPDFIFCSSSQIFVWGA